MLSPHKEEIKKEILMKGAKGIVSFLPFLPHIRSNNDITAPMMKDNNIFKIAFLNPSIKLNIAMSLMSPPPIPSFDINDIIVNNNPESKELIILSGKDMDISYV